MNNRCLAGAPCDTSLSRCQRSASTHPDNLPTVVSKQATAYRGGGGVRGQKNFVYLKSTSNFGPLLVFSEEKFSDVGGWMGGWVGGSGGGAQAAIPPLPPLPPVTVSCGPSVTANRWRLPAAQLTKCDGGCVPTAVDGLVTTVSPTAVAFYIFRCSALLWLRAPPFHTSLRHRSRTCSRAIRAWVRS